MASLKEIKGRIASIQSTQKITSAMRMVSSAKLHRVQGMTEKFLYYRDKLEEIAASLSPSLSTDGAEGKSVCLIPISSNSGLCGAFNSNIAKAVLQRTNELRQQGATVLLLPIGKKIAHELKKSGEESNLQYVSQMEKVEKGGTYADATSFMDFVLQQQRQGNIDSVEFIYHHFRSMGSQVITTTRPSLSPAAPIKDEWHDELPQEERPSSPAPQEEDAYLTEPSRQELMTALFPRLLNAQVYGILLDSLTSEHAARMLAMQTADDNANDLLKELTLLYNKTRQQAITNELIDIMGGRAAE